MLQLVCYHFIDLKIQFTCTCWFEIYTQSHYIIKIHKHYLYINIYSNIYLYSMSIIPMPLFVCVWVSTNYLVIEAYDV